MSMGIYEQLEWLTERVKKLCCSIEQIKESGAGSYKVYTALLTQSGGDVLDQLDETTPTQNVTKGVTYTIDTASDGDFLNVGAPNNNTGTSFVAINNSVPTSWGQSGASLLFNTGAPVVTVLENTIGNVYWTYDSAGVYEANLTAAFPIDKTTLPSYTAYSASLGEYFILSCVTQDMPDRVLINSVRFSDQSFLDDVLINTPIEIRVYN